MKTSSPPSTKPPSKRAGDQPKPPMIAATKALSSGVKPICGSTMPGLCRPQHAGQPGKAGSDREGDDDQPVHVEADELRGAEILRRRAHAEPGIRARHEPAEKGERDASRERRSPR